MTSVLPEVGDIDSDVGCGVELVLGDGTGVWPELGEAVGWLVGPDGAGVGTALGEGLGWGLGCGVGGMAGLGTRCGVGPGLGWGVG